MPVARKTHDRVPATVYVDVAVIAIGVILPGEHNGQFAGFGPRDGVTPVHLVGSPPDASGPFWGRIFEIKDVLNRFLGIHSFEIADLAPNNDSTLWRAVDLLDT